MMNIDEDVYDLHSRIVKTSGFDQMKWRRFHVACYKRIVEVLPDARQRKGILVANENVAGVVSTDMQDVLRLAEVEIERAWTKVDSLKVKSEEWDAIWPVSVEADQAWCNYLGWNCVQLACSTTLDEFSTPEPAAALVAWNGARLKCINDGLELIRENVEPVWQLIHSEEEAAQRQLFLAEYGLN